jgi:hypothetical protein
MANQSEITSPKAGKSCLRVRDGALVTEKSVAWPVPRLRDSSGNPFKMLIVFMRLLIGAGHIAAIARVWDFVIPR